MDWIKIFYEYINEHRRQFNLKVHSHSDYEGTTITIYGGKEVIVKETDLDYDHCHHRAYDSLKLNIDHQLKKIDELLENLMSEEAI